MPRIEIIPQGHDRTKPAPLLNICQVCAPEFKQGFDLGDKEQDGLKANCQQDAPLGDLMFVEIGKTVEHPSYGDHIAYCDCCGTRLGQPDD